MNFPPSNLSPFYSDVLQQTQLGKLCGQGELFRDRYEILRMLGRGGFGVTFLARDIYLPSQPLCVIKQLCPKVTDPPALENARKRFEREAKTLSHLGSHSQVPMLLDYFTIEEEFYLVQEYIRGATLARLIRRCGPLSEAAVKQFLRQMLPLLEYIHKQGVIHRDIKPQNIIRCEDDGRLVLIDFGAVKEQISQSGGAGIKTATTNFIGTVGFAPPEQFSLRPSYSSDIYALGVTCLYLLTGKAPLDFESDRLTGELLWQKTARVSEPFSRILDQMLKVSLRDRYPSATAVLEALAKISPSENLAGCMNVQTKPSERKLTEVKTEAYHSPTSKAAIAIRDWKARLQERHNKYRKQPSTKKNFLKSSSN